MYNVSLTNNGNILQKELPRWFKG